MRDIYIYNFLTDLDYFHPAFAIPSPEHLPRCSYPEHHGLRLPLPLQYSFSRWSLRHRSSRSNRSSFRFRCGPALHTQGHGNRPDTAAADAHRRGTDGIIFSSRRCFLFFIHSGVRLNLSQVSIPNEWYCESWMSRIGCRCGILT